MAKSLANVATPRRAGIDVTSSSERQTYTVREAAHILGVGRNSCYEAVQRGQIPSLRVGRRLLIPKVALDRLLAQER